MAIKTLTFSGTPGSPLATPGGYLAYASPFVYDASGIAVRAPSGEFSQLVDNQVCAGVNKTTIYFNWIEGVNSAEWGGCAINPSQSGFSVLIYNQFVPETSSYATLGRIRKEVGGLGGSDIDTVSDLSISEGLQKLVFTYTLPAGTIEVELNDISIMSGIYTDFESLNQGIQEYTGTDGFSFASLITEVDIAGVTIDTISSPVTHGQTGRAVTTTGLGTLTSMTVGGVAVTALSAPSGDGTWAMPARTDGATLSGYGTKAVVVGDGTATASGTIVVNPPATQAYVTLTSVNTSAGYLGAYRTLNVGDQIAFDLAATLGVSTNYIDVDGGIYTDFSGSQTIWHWVATTGVTTEITLINGVVADTTPDAFTFTDVTNASLSTTYTSNTITVSGIDTPAAISITGGTYSIDGGSYTSSSGTVTNAQTVTVRVVSSASASTAVNATLTIGGVSDTYTVTTAAGDTTPSAFTFTDITGATPSQVYTSNTITVSGIDTATAISVTGGTYNINGGAYTSSPGTVTNGQTVTTRITSSASSLTAVNSTVTIGGVSDTFTVTTQFVADSTPDAFTFTDVTQQATNSVINSAPITVSGINSSTAISVSGGLYSIDGGAYTASPGTVSNGQLVRAQVTTPWTHSTATSAIVTIGGVSDTFTATTTTTVDTTPTAFTFNDVTGVAQNSTNDSNTITVTGINAPAAISITGGTYSVNGGAFTATSGNVNYNDYVVVRNVASASLNTTTNTVLTIGGVSDTYSVTTSAVAITNKKGFSICIGIKIGL